MKTINVVIAILLVGKVNATNRSPEPNLSPLAEGESIVEHAEEALEEYIDRDLEATNIAKSSHTASSKSRKSGKSSFETTDSVQKTSNKSGKSSSSVLTAISAAAQEASGKSGKSSFPTPNDVDSDISPELVHIAFGKFGKSSKTVQDAAGSSSYTESTHATYGKSGKPLVDAEGSAYTASGSAGEEQSMSMGTEEAQTSGTSTALPVPNKVTAVGSSTDSPSGTSHDQPEEDRGIQFLSTDSSASSTSATSTSAMIFALSIVGVFL